MHVVVHTLLVVAVLLAADTREVWRAEPASTLIQVADGMSMGTMAVPGKPIEIQFDGRIAPHEGTRIDIDLPGTEPNQDPASWVVLPEGWRAEVRYDSKRATLSVMRFRPDRAPAFPGAEGFGKYTLGGRGGRVLFVDNLDDTGPGSFRAACEAEGPRMVVFRVSGTITLDAKLEVKNPFITIAGQTAPGDGICLRGHPFTIEADHVIVRYLRVRPGDLAGIELDALSGEGDHIIIDHCSVSWGTDETLSFNKASNLSVQWCMITESLTKSVHKKGSHGYGGLWGGPGGSFHHNLLAHHTSRTPRASGNAESGLLDFRNNVVYNWGFNSAYGGELWPRNWVNNYYKPGPATRDDVRCRLFLQKDPRGKMYCAGNEIAECPEGTIDNWGKAVHYAEDGEATESTLRVDEPFVVAPVETHSAAEAFALVLDKAGASLRRDKVDARLVEEVRNGTATFGETYAGGGKGIIDSQEAVGGWPELASWPAPDDRDADGLPDDWEEAQGLNADSAADAALYAEDGYTHLEHYLNSLVPLKL